jgi:hypothetical protein
MDKKKIKLKLPTLRQLIRESVEHILNEELSISNEVKRISKDIKFQILRTHEQFQYYFYGIGDITVTPTFTEVPETVSSVYGCFNATKKELEITVPLDSKGDIIDNLLSPCIMHEVEHVFQYAKKIGKAVNDTYYDFLARKPTIEIVG